MELTDKEARLIKAMRAMGFGEMKVQVELTVDVKKAEPVLLRKGGTEVL